MWRLRSCALNRLNCHSTYSRISGDIGGCSSRLVCCSSLPIAFTAACVSRLILVIRPNDWIFRLFLIEFLNRQPSPNTNRFNWWSSANTRPASVFHGFGTRLMAAISTSPRTLTPTVQRPSSSRLIVAPSLARGPAAASNTRSQFLRVLPSSGVS
jgi:hypothetical protein